MRVPGAGDAPMSTGTSPEAKKRETTGDLLVRVNVQGSRDFRRQGTNIYYDAVIPLHTAVLGGQARVPTLDEDVHVKVKAGTQPGGEAFLPGRGIASLKKPFNKGDLFINFMVEIPRSVRRISSYLVSGLS
jgi:molecular chaperone DnaJ